MRPPRSRSSGPTPSHPPAARAAPRKALPGNGGASVPASALLTPMPRVPTRLVPGSPADLRRREEERARRLAIARHAEAAPFEVLVPPQPRAAAVLVPTQDSIDDMIRNYRNVLVDEAPPAQHAAPPREANRVTPARAPPAVTDTSPAPVSGASTAPEGPDDVVSLVVEGVFRALGVGRHKAAPMSSNAVQQLMITASKPVASQDTFSMAHSVFLQLQMAARDAVLFAAKLDLAVEDAMNDPAESDDSSAAPSSSWGSELARVTEGTVAHDFARALRCHMWRSRARHDNAEGHDEEATRTGARLVISPLQFDKGPHGSLLSSSHAWVFVTQAAAEMGYPRCAELTCSTSTPPPVASATPLSSEEHAANRQWFCGALELLMFLLWVAELYSFAEIVVGLTVEEASRGDKDDATAESRTRSVPFPKADSTHVSWSAVHQHHSTTLKGKLAAAIDGLTRREYENDRPPETALRLTEQLQHGVVQRACALQLEAVEAQLCTYASLCSKLGNHVPVDALLSLDRDATKSAIRSFDLMTAAGERVARLRSALRNVGELVATAIMSSADPNPTQNIVDEDNDVSASDVSAALEDLCRSLADTVRVNLGAMQRKKVTKGLEQAWTSHSRLGLSKADIDSARRNAAQLQHDWYGDYSFPLTLQGALLDIVSVADDGAAVTDPEPGLMLPVARPRMTDDAPTITEPSPVTQAIYPWYSLTSQWNGYRSTTSKDDNTVACWTAVGEVAQNQSTTFGMLLGSRHGEEQELSTTPDFQSRRQDIATRYCLRVPQTAVDRFAKLARRSVEATVPSAHRAADEDAPLDEDPLRATTEEDAKANPFNI